MCCPGRRSAIVCSNEAPGRLIERSPFLDGRARSWSTPATFDRAAFAARVHDGKPPSFSAGAPWDLLEPHHAPQSELCQQRVIERTGLSQHGGERLLRNAEQPRARADRAGLCRVRAKELEDLSFGHHAIKLTTNRGHLPRVRLARDSRKRSSYGSVVGFGLGAISNTDGPLAPQHAWWLVELTTGR
jgi:hypothetical protein